MARKIFTLVVLAALMGTGAQAQEGYQIQPGDVLRIEVIEDSGLNRSALVAPDGRFTLPLAGNVQAAGQTVEALQADIAQRLAGNFAAAPNVYVSIEKLSDRPARALGGGGGGGALTIYVMGEAAKVGRLDLRRGTTLLQAFAEMGGFTPFAATKRIQLRRTDPATGAEKIYRLDYDAILAGRSPNAQVRLQEGDVIVIPQRALFE